MMELETTKIGQPAAAATAASGRHVNPNLNFVLAGYCDPKAIPGAEPSTQTALRSLSAMKRRARWEAARMKMPLHQVWEEGVSEALARLAHSDLAHKYRHNPQGVAPFVNVVIRRSVRDVVLHQLFTEASELPAGQEFIGRTPAELAEANELLQMLKTTIAKLADLEQLSKQQGNSTAYVHIHRQRKDAWRKISHLFNHMTFRPKKWKA